MKKEFLTNCVECGKEVWERGEIVKGFFDTEGVKYEKEPICASCLIEKNIENGYTKCITNLKKGEKKMKLLLILALFLGGCAVEPAVVKDSGGNEIPWTPLEPSKKCESVPFEGRLLGEMRSVSLAEENGVFTYDFTYLGLCDESYDDFNFFSVLYFRKNEYDYYQYRIKIEKNNENINWIFEGDLEKKTIEKEKIDIFKQSVEGIDFSQGTQKISIVIKNSLNKTYYYKGFSASGEVQLVGIYLHYCEGDCNSNTPYNPIPEP